MTNATSVVTGTDFVTVPNTDYERAREFYGSTLGLPFAKQWGDSPPASSRRAASRSR